MRDLYDPGEYNQSEPEVENGRDEQDWRCLKKRLLMSFLTSLVLLYGGRVIWDLLSGPEEQRFILERSVLYDTYATVYYHISNGETESTSISFDTVTGASVTVHGSAEVFDSNGSKPYAVVYDYPLWRDARVELYVPEGGVTYRTVEAYTFS